jgi:hypothetical protein
MAMNVRHFIVEVFMSKLRFLSGAVVALPILVAGSAFAQTAPSTPGVLPTDPNICGDATTGAGQDCIDTNRPGSTQDLNGGSSGGGLEGGSSIQNNGGSSGTLPDTQPGSGSGSSTGSSGGSSGGLSD